MGAKACPWALTLVTLVKVTAVVTVAMLAEHMAFYAGYAVYAGYAGDVCSLRALLLYFFAFNTSLPLFLTYDSFFRATLLSIALFCESALFSENMFYNMHLLIQTTLLFIPLFFPNDSSFNTTVAFFLVRLFFSMSSKGVFSMQLVGV